MPQSGACRFLSHLVQMCKVSITSGAASAQLQPFDQEILRFWGLFGALGAAALRWLLWDALVCGSCCFSTAPNSVWSSREMANAKIVGKYTLHWFLGCVLIYLNLCITLNVMKNEQIFRKHPSERTRHSVFNQLFKNPEIPIREPKPAVLISQIILNTQALMQEIHHFDVFL